MDKQKLNNEPGDVLDLPSMALGKMKDEYPAQGPEDLFGYIGMRSMLYTVHPSFAIQTT